MEITSPLKPVVGDLRRVARWERRVVEVVDQLVPLNEPFTVAVLFIFDADNESTCCSAVVSVVVIFACCYGFVGL